VKLARGNDFSADVASVREFVIEKDSWFEFVKGERQRGCKYVVEDIFPEGIQEGRSCEKWSESAEEAYTNMMVESKTRSRITCF
jgi:hypothetical protein